MPHGDITHTEIPVTDVEAAQEFYSRLFGWTFVSLPGFEDYPMWRAPNGISGGGIVSQSTDVNQPLSYVSVDSINDTIALAVEHGATVLTERSPIDDSSWWAVIRDPDGNRIGLVEGSSDAP